MSACFAASSIVVPSSTVTGIESIVKFIVVFPPPLCLLYCTEMAGLYALAALDAFVCVDSIVFL